VLAFGLFWFNTFLTVFVLLNLLIAVLNTTYEQVTERAFNEWLFLRLNTMLEFESSTAESPSSSGLDEYFIEVEGLNNRRTVELSLERLDIESGAGAKDGASASDASGASGSKDLGSRDPDAAGGRGGRAWPHV
jgi:hypothetical protein